MSNNPNGADPLAWVPWSDRIRPVTPAQDARRAQAEYADALARIRKINQETAERAAASEAARIERGKAELESERQRRLAAWRYAGGTESDFNASWPELRRQYLAEKTAASLADELYTRMKAGPPITGYAAPTPADGADVVAENHQRWP